MTYFSFFDASSHLINEHSQLLLQWLQIKDHARELLYESVRLFSARLVAFSVSGLILHHFLGYLIDFIDVV